MELRQLRYLVRIVELGSVSRASQSLHVAQPALSQQVARLEEELGTKLLIRSARGVTPTEAGRAVYRHASGVLRQVDATRLVAAAADRGPAGQVSIGLPWTISALLGLKLLLAVAQAHEAVRLEIVEGPSATLRAFLAEGRLDVAVVFGDAMDSGLLLTPVAAEPLYVVGAAESLRGRSALGAAEAAALPLLLLSRPNGVRELVEDVWSTIGVRPNVRAEINAPGVLIDAIKAGFGFGILPASGVEDAIRSGLLDAAVLDEGRLRRTVYLGVSRLHPVSIATQAVAETLKQLMANAMESGRWQASALFDAADEGGAD